MKQKDTKPVARERMLRRVTLADARSRGLKEFGNEVREHEHKRQLKECLETRS